MLDTYVWVICPIIFNNFLDGCMIHNTYYSNNKQRFLLVQKFVINFSLYLNILKSLAYIFLKNMERCDIMYTVHANAD